MSEAFQIYHDICFWYNYSENLILKLYLNLIYFKYNDTENLALIFYINVIYVFFLLAIAPLLLHYLSLLKADLNDHFKYCFSVVIYLHEPIALYFLSIYQI